MSKSERVNSLKHRIFNSSVIIYMNENNIGNNSEYYVRFHYNIFGKKCINKNGYRYDQIINASDMNDLRIKLKDICKRNTEDLHVNGNKFAIDNIIKVSNTEECINNIIKDIMMMKDIHGNIDVKKNDSRYFFEYKGRNRYAIMSVIVLFNKFKSSSECLKNNTYISGIEIET